MTVKCWQSKIIYSAVSVSRGSRTGLFLDNIIAVNSVNLCSTQYFPVVKVAYVTKTQLCRIKYEIRVVREWHLTVLYDV